MFKKSIICGAVAFLMSAGGSSLTHAQGFVLTPNSGQGAAHAPVTREAPAYKGVTVPVDPNARAVKKRRTGHYGTNNYGGSQQRKKLSPVGYGSSRVTPAGRGRTGVYGTQKTEKPGEAQMSRLRAYQARRDAANKKKYQERMQKKFEEKYGKPKDSSTSRNARASGYAPKSRSGSFVLPQKE